MNDHLIGYIINCQTYRENDQLAMLFNEHGVHSIIYKGFHKPSSRQQSYGQFLTYVDVLVDFKDGKMMRVKNGRCIKSFVEQRQQHQWIKYMSMASELVRYFHEAEEYDLLFPLFEEVSRSGNIYSSFIFYIKSILEIQGLQPQIDTCVRCGSTKIKGFSIAEGGFICKSCASQSGIKFDLADIERLKLIRYVFLANQEQFKLIADLFKESDLIAQILVEYYQYHGGIRLKSLEFYKNVL